MPDKTAAEANPEGPEAAFLGPWEKRFQGLPVHPNLALTRHNYVTEVCAFIKEKVSCAV